MAYFKYIDGSDKSIGYFELNKSLISIGSKIGNDIRLSDSGVSPTHANLLKKSAGYQINLLDRSKKLYINGESVRRGLLQYGDQIRLGRFELRLMEGSPPKEEQRKELETLERLVLFSKKLMEESSPSKLFERLLEDVVLLTALL